MKQQERTVFICDHCNRKMFVKNACLKHEDVCSRNPVNFIKCSGCDFLEEYKKEYTSNEDSDYPYERTSKAFWCKKLGVGLYPPKAKYLAEKYPENFKDEVVMPSECEHYLFSLPF